jgi:pyridoxal phosphate enzyme (YggS family)
MTDASTRRTHILDRIASAAARARRKPDEVSLVAVSKTRSAGEIEALIAAGQRDFGESRVQEAEAKWAGLRTAHPDVRLHMIGRLQSNKAAEAVALFDTIHSLDRASLLDTLSAATAKTGKFPACYVQVNIGEEEQKGGLAIAELGGFLDQVRASPLPLAGLMCIPPAGQEPAPYFALLNQLARRHDVTGLSMGMSADFEEAVMLGATAVRIGSALFN